MSDQPDEELENIRWRLENGLSHADVGRLLARVDAQTKQIDALTLALIADAALIAKVLKRAEVAESKAFCDTWGAPGSDPT